MATKKRITGTPSRIGTLDRVQSMPKPLGQSQQGISRPNILAPAPNPFQTVASTQPKQQSPQQTKPSGKVEVFRDSTSGKLSGITLPDGRTFLGLNPADVEKINKAEQEKLRTPEGAVEVGQQRQVEAQQEQAQALAGEVGQVSPELLSNIQAESLDVGQAAGAGVIGALGGAVAGGGLAKVLGGVGAGAGIGAVGGPVGVGVGALIGLAGGIYSAVKGNINNQLGENIQAKAKILSDGTSNLNKLIRLANADPANAPKYVADFNTQLALIQRAYGSLSLESKRDLNRFLGKDGTVQLQEFANFYVTGGEKDLYEDRMRLAIIAPTSDVNALMADVQETQ